VANYIEATVAAFVKGDLTPPKTESNAILHRYQPSQLLVDDLGNFYVLRITEAQASHAPASVTEVADIVDGFSIHFNNDIACMKSGFFRAAALFHRAH